MFSLLKETGFSTKELSATDKAEHSVIKCFRIKMREVNLSIIIGRNRVSHTF